MTEKSVLIVGAGPTGMTMAIELKRFGFDVRLIDKAPQPARYSQALVVQARTLEQFQRYGIAADAVAQGRKLTRASLSSEGKPLVSFSLDQIPSRYPYVLFLPQNKTEALLNARMNSLGVFAERGSELISFTNNANGCTAMIRSAEGHEGAHDVRWIVGCDGSHSTVRTQLGIPFEGSSVDLSFFLGDLEVEGPDSPTDELSLHLHAGDVVFMGRISDRITRVIVALHSQQSSDLGAGGQTLSLQDFQAAVDHANVKLTVKAADWMTPFHVNDRQAKHYRAGSAFLAGDASHIHSPVGGQGMNTGIQDAANLAWKLAAVARGANERLLNSYDEERSEVGKALLRTTSRGLAVASSANPIIEKLRDALAPIFTGFPGVQAMLRGFVSETAIGYRHSSIVRDAGGDGTLRAGDRMPDLTTGDTTLLTGWTGDEHLLLTLGNEGPGTRLNTHVIDPAGLTDEGRLLLGQEGKWIVLRPDGYVGFRGTFEHAEALAAYRQAWALPR